MTSAQRAQTTICISSPEVDPSPEQETAPSSDGPPTSPLPPDEPAKIKFVLGDENGKKPEPDTLKPGWTLVVSQACLT